MKTENKLIFHHSNKKIYIFILLLISLLNISFSLLAQENQWLPDSIIYKAETSATFSGGENTPFWLVNNRYGLGSPQFNNGFVRGQVIKPLSSDNKLSWSAGLDLVGAWHLPSAFRIQQLYAELKYRRLFISLGSKEHHSAINDTELSSGNLLFSNNYLPIPQLRIGTYDFAPFWGCDGWFSVKAYLSFGMFTDSNWQKDWVIKDGNRSVNTLLCGRGIWFKFGKEDTFPLIGELGLEMGTQFGGTVYIDGRKIKMPLKPIDWIKAVIPLSGNKDFLEEEYTNVQGNMNGEYSLSLIFKPKSDWQLKVYFEHYFEDQSQMFMEYGFWKDGLMGVELTLPKNPFVSKFLYEYIHTKDQTGAVNNDYSPEIPEQVSGRDNYYNHYLYNAWQTWGMTIGTPLAISPLYNRIHQLTMFNTRFIANHFGLEGNPINNIKWRALFTFSQNWGTYWLPLPKQMNNFSGLAEVEYNCPLIRGLYAKGSLAWDKGELLGNNFGGMISIGFRGNLSFGK